MANPTIGYLITVDVVTIVNHSTLRAINVIQNTDVSRPMTYVIPSGVKIDYDATSDGPTTPGTMTQDILCTTGGIALFNTMVAKKNHHVVSVFSPLSGADITNNNTRIFDVVDITPNRVKRDGDVHIRIIVDIIGTWT